VAEWICFLHAPRENFAATMTDDEQAAWREHFQRLQELLADGVLVLAGPTLGPINTGIIVFEAADETAARAIMNADPTIAAGFATGELREFRVSLLRGRDHPATES
jgi:uncharacterized protein YciI